MFYFYKTVRHRWSSGHLHSRRFPKLDQKQIGIPRAPSSNHRHRVVPVRAAEFDTRRHILLPADRSLCGLHFDHVFGLLSNHCHRLVLRGTTTIEKYHTNDWKGAIAVLQIMLVGCCTRAAICKFRQMLHFLDEIFYWRLFFFVYFRACGYSAWSIIHHPRMIMETTIIHCGLMA